jgi:hypothetical protein
VIYWIGSGEEKISAEFQSEILIPSMAGQNGIKSIPVFFWVFEGSSIRQRASRWQVEGFDPKGHFLATLLNAVP